MKIIAKKILVVAAVVIGTAFGSGVMDVSASNPQQTNHLQSKDASGSNTVTIEQTAEALTVSQGRHRIGFLAN